VTGQEAVAAHIAAQAALRTRAQERMTRIWQGLPAYDEANVPQFLAAAVPLDQAAARASVSITNAFLAKRLKTAPAAIDPSKVLTQLRGGVSPTDVYRRPFVTVWSALKDGTSYADAVRAGGARATSTVAMDVQLAMRQTLVAVGGTSTKIVGYQRVPDPGACAFCTLIAGQRYHTDQLMPVHNHCGCGVDVITAENRGDFTGKRANDQAIPATVGPDGTVAAIVDHGELGPLLVNGHDHFTAL
jgi:hypothetical protein